MDIAKKKLPKWLAMQRSPEILGDVGQGESFKLAWLVFDVPLLLTADTGEIFFLSLPSDSDCFCLPRK